MSDTPPALAASGRQAPRRQWLRRLGVVIGPGLVVMLADSDAGSVITAAQSGARWGYRLLLLQFALVPVLFLSNAQREQLSRPAASRSLDGDC